MRETYPGCTESVAQNPGMLAVLDTKQKVPSV